MTTIKFIFVKILKVLKLFFILFIKVLLKIIYTLLFVVHKILDLCFKKNVVKQTNSHLSHNAIIEFQNVWKYFGDKKHKTAILKGVNFSIQRGEIVSIIGRSGGGKTTTARIINGLESYDDGCVFIDGELLTQDNRKKLSKKTAFVFQNFNLFPHFSVLKNITYTPIKVDKRNKKDVLNEALKLLEIFSMSQYKDCYVHKLSGGQKQRVAIIRALLLHPEVLIMDEPTASLDPELVDDLANLIKKIHMNTITIIIITHNIDFAKKISNRMITFRDGVAE